MISLNARSRARLILIAARRSMTERFARCLPTTFWAGGFSVVGVDFLLFPVFSEKNIGAGCGMTLLPANSVLINRFIFHSQKNG
ncbi:MAG: hypothetical protein IPM36_24600 [Lewinellaceae bacterium]|nr:hypothetical protein [Lewinellaceae bacterium]